MSSVIIPKPVPDARMRVFLFHHAGGSHLLYRDWVPHFPADLEACLVEAPGRGRLSHLDPLDDVADIVSFLLPDIRQLLDKPFILFGHSMGAMIAYELTHRLLTAGLPLPSWLGLSARAAPRPDGGLDVRNRHLMPADEAAIAAALAALEAPKQKSEFAAPPVEPPVEKPSEPVAPLEPRDGQ